MPASEPSPHSERYRLAVLLFTDIVDSVTLQQRVGTEVYAGLLRRHDDVFRGVLAEFPGATVINHTGDGFLARFERSSDAVRAALRFQYRLLAGPNAEPELSVRVGLHQGEILEDRCPSDGTRPGAVGMAVNLAARVMALAQGGQILLTRPVFDEARLYVREHPPADGGAERPVLEWMAHGPYLFKGNAEPVELFEVGARELAPLRPPPDTDKAVRSVSAEDAATLGWRPASGLEIPRRAGWRLTEKLGEGGFGEVWLAQHARTREQRVFKFCFDPVRLRSFKRELSLFRLIRDALGKRDDIASLHEVQVEAPPFYLESDYCEGGNLRQWADRAGGIQNVPVATRLVLMGRICRAVAAAHSLGIIHRDIKPSNVFINDTEGGPRPRLADFGIGILSDPDKASGYDVTLTGFTQQTINRGESTPTGTRLYTAPEYLVGKPPTMQGDVFALGVLLYQMVAGDLQLPPGSGWERHVSDPLLRDDIAAAMDVDPECRLASASALADRLESLDRRREAEEEKQRLERQAAAAGRHRRRVQWLLAASAAGVTLTTATIWLAIREARRSSELEVAGRNADAARAVALRSVISLQTGTGTMRGDSGDVSLGALWMAEALRTAEKTEEAATARIRFRNYARSAPFPMAAFRPASGSWVRRMHFHAHRSRLLLESGEGEWELWDLESEHAVPLPGVAPIRSAAWDRGGERLYTVDSDGTVRILDDASGQTLAEATTADTPSALAVSHEGTLLAVAGRRLTLFRIDSTPSGLRLITAGEPPPLGRPGVWAAFAPDDSAVATASMGWPGTVQVFTIRPGDPVPGLEPVGEVPHCLRAKRSEVQFQPPLFTPDGSLLVIPTGKYPVRAGLTDGTIRLDASGDLQAVWNGGEDLASLALTSDGRFLAGGSFRFFSLVDLAAAKETQPRTATGHDVGFCGFTPGGTHLITATDDGLVNVWRRMSDTQSLLRRWHAASGTIDSAALSPDGTLLAVADSSGPLVRVWMNLYGAPPAAAAPFDGTWSRLAVSPSGKFFVPSGSSYKNCVVGEIAVYDAETFRAAGPLWQMEVSPQAAVFSADERFVFTAGGTSSRALLQKWDFRSGREAVPPLRLPARTAAMALSPDGGHVALYLRDGSLLVADTSDLRRIAMIPFSRPSNSFFYFYNGLLSWDRESGLLAAASTDGRAALFRLDHGELVRQGAAVETGENINVFIPAPDRRHWITGGGDNRLRAWDMNTGQPAPKSEFPQPDWVFGAVFTADGKEMLTTCRDGFARVWDWNSGRLLYPSAFVPNEVYFSHWVPGDRYYVTGGADATLRLWEKKSGHPLMPPLFTGMWPMLSLEPAAGGRTLLTTGRGPWASVIKLDDWLDASAAGLDELRELAEVSANTRLIGSSEERLNADEWLERWSRVRASGFFRLEQEVLHQRTAAWHRMEYQFCRHMGIDTGAAVHAAALRRSGDEASLWLQAGELDSRSRKDPSVLPETIKAWRALAARFPEALICRINLAAALSRSGDLPAAWAEAKALLMTAPGDSAAWELAESCAAASPHPAAVWRSLHTAARALHLANPSLADVAVATAFDGPETTLKAAVAAVEAAPQDHAARQRYAAALACATVSRFPVPPDGQRPDPAPAPPGPWIRLFLVLRSLIPSPEAPSTHWAGRTLAELNAGLESSGEAAGLAGYARRVLGDGDAASVLIQSDAHPMPPPDNWPQPDFAVDAKWAATSLPLCVSAPGSENKRLGVATAAWVRTTFRLPAQVAPLRNLRLRLSAADGWIIWFNGVEIGRVRVPEGPLHTGTLATAPGNEAVEYHLPLELARQDASNTLAIAVLRGKDSTNPPDCHPELITNHSWLKCIFPHLTPDDFARLFDSPDWPVPRAIREMVEAHFQSDTPRNQ